MAIKHKLAIGFGLLFIILFAGFWLTLKVQLGQNLSRQSRTLGEIVATQTADSVTELVLANDLLGLNVILAQLTQESGVLNVTVTDVDGLVLASTRDNHASNTQAPEYFAAITLQDAIAGHVILQLEPALQKNPLAKPQSNFYLVITLGLILITALSWFLAKLINRPFARVIDDIDNGSVSEEISGIGEDESGQLLNRVRELTQRQQRLLEQIETTGLPDPEDMDNLALRAERRMASFLLIEVSSIDTAIELLHPATLSTLLQEYQFYLRQAARLYRGTVNRIDGARLLVSFDIRHCQDEHAFNAICCGQLFLLLMQKVAEKHRAEHAQSLEFNLVVHSGDAYFSPVWKKRNNSNKPSRTESVIGKTVDLAYTLTNYSTSGALLVSELSLDLAGGQQRFSAIENKELSRDGDNLTLMTYSISADTGSHAGLLARQCRHLIPDADAVNNEKHNKEI